MKDLWPNAAAPDAFSERTLSKRLALLAAVAAAFAALAVLRFVGQDALYDRILGAGGLKRYSWRSAPR